MNPTPSIILNAFNDQLAELFIDITNIFPDNIDIKTAQNTLSLVRKANPKMIVKIWQKYIVDKYGDKFDSNDISFFIEKDYNEDLNNTDQPTKIMDAIDRLRDPIKNMNLSNQAKTMKYLQNLKKLCCMYHQLC
jgi:hypothetical protein